MKFKKSFKLFLIVFMMFIFVGVVHAAPQQITTSGDYMVATDGIFPQRIQGETTPIFCLDHGKNYAGGYTFNLVGTPAVNSGYACTVLDAAARGVDVQTATSQTGTAAYRDLQWAIWNYGYDSSSTCTDLAKKTTCTEYTATGSVYEKTSERTKTGETTIDVSVSNNNLKMKLTNDKKYYVSNKITVAADTYESNGTRTGKYTFDISGFPAGTFLSKSSNCTGTAVASPTTETAVYACVPVFTKDSNNNVTFTNFAGKSLKFQISGQVKETYKKKMYKKYTRNCTTLSRNASVAIYSIAADSYVAADDGNTYSTAANPPQREALITYNENTTTTPQEEERQEADETLYQYKSASASVTFTAPYGAIKIIKTDSLTDTPVEGAKFKLYIKVDNEYVEVTKNALGQTINLVTNASGIITASNLIYGDYKVVEVEPATGYEKNDQVYDGIVIDSENAYNLDVQNTPISTLISKQDITNEAELPGATIAIIDETGEVIQEFVSTDEPKKFYLKPGKYKLIETAAPEGYDGIETEFEFEILGNGDIRLISPEETEVFKSEGNHITIYNSPTPVDVPDTGKMDIAKYIIGLLLAVFGTVMLVVFIRKGQMQKKEQ